MRLNGWQRIWVVLMGLWALPVLGLGYSTFPHSLYHSTPSSGRVA
jgi:hypothetical protein